METMMKTATAAPNAETKPVRDALVERYGAIGISAVAAAAPFTRARKPSADRSTARYPLSMD
jgi:hypothetical protein